MPMEGESAPAKAELEPAVTQRRVDILHSSFAQPNGRAHVERDRIRGRDGVESLPRRKPSAEGILSAWWPIIRCIATPARKAHPNQQLALTMPARKHLAAQQKAGHLALRDSSQRHSLGTPLG
jgi:hypothetical protein